jgi:hypothetical protein
MDPDWDLGGYTYKQLKTFGLTLESLGIIYNIALNSLRNEEKRLNLRIRIKSFDEWVSELSQWSKLSRQITKLIINDLIYDPMLYQTGRQKPHVMYQPFFRFKNGQLGVSSTIIRISNIERNAWSLISLIRPEIGNDLKNRKEFFWIQELQKQTESLGLKSFPNIKFKFDGSQGEIDLLIIDEKLKFGLICELKWLTSSDDPKGVESDDEQITKGVKQAIRATRWIESDISHLAQRIGIKADELKKFDFKPLVMSKESLPSGFLEKTNVPVINQRLFNWIIAEPHHRNIVSLWNVANSTSYLPMPSKHFETISPTIKWGEMRFILKDIAFKLTNRWDPQKDITFADSE